MIEVKQPLQRANDSATGLDQVYYQLLTHLRNCFIGSSESAQPRLGIWLFLFSAVVARSGSNSHFQTR